MSSEQLDALAREWVGLAADHGFTLDGSAASMDENERVIARLFDDGSGLDPEVWWAALGAYTGNVLVRDVGGSWEHNAEQDQLGVHFHGATWAFPFAKALKRLRSGPEDSLASFVFIAGKAARGEL